MSLPEIAGTLGGGGPRDPRDERDLGEFHAAEAFADDEFGLVRDDEPDDEWGEGDDVALADLAHRYETWDQRDAPVQEAELQTQVGLLRPLPP